MKSDIETIEQVIPVETLPDGEYPGIWGGYQVSVNINGVNYIIKTRVGIRTIAAPCVVSVQNGLTTIKTQE